MINQKFVVVVAVAIVAVLVTIVVLLLTKKKPTHPTPDPTKVRYVRMENTRTETNPTKCVTAAEIEVLKDGTNVAHNQGVLVSVSSTAGDGTYFKKENLIDGQQNPPFVSNWSENEWVLIDLGQEYELPLTVKVYNRADACASAPTDNCSSHIVGTIVKVQNTQQVTLGVGQQITTNAAVNTFTFENE
jgi:hypothetical protein